VYKIWSLYLQLFQRYGSFVRSMRAGVQPTMDPSAKTFMSVQCASPGRGGELIGVCGVCASCVGWRKGWVGCPPKFKRFNWPDHNPLRDDLSSMD